MPQPPCIKCALFIDDDKATNYINRFLAQRSNYFENIIVVFSAKEGLEYLEEVCKNKTLAPEIIFLDINMPAMNGWDFLNDLNKMEALEKSNLKIYMLTSSSRKEDINKAKEYSSVRGFLTKPLTNELLENLVNDESTFEFN